MSTLAIDWVPWIGGLSALFVVVIAVAVLARSRHEDAIDPEIQTRLLLGEDPEQIDRDLAERAAGAAPVTDLPHVADLPQVDESPG